MAEVTLAIGGRDYKVGCRDGEEPHLRAVAALVDGKVREAGRALGGLGEVRQLLLGALLMADELLELRARTPAATSPALADALDALASRIERLADGLEQAGAGA